LNVAFWKAPDVDSPPRIWWCPTGPLAFLPIHAAERYKEHTAGSSVSDYVVSFYTPTLNMNINANESRELLRKFRGLQAISQPNTPGQSALPNTAVELSQIEQQARNLMFGFWKGR
jgi:hypothetical protein